MTKKAKMGELIKMFKMTKLVIVSKKNEIGQKRQKCLSR